MAIAPLGTDGHVEATAQGTAVTSALPTGFTFDGTQFCLLEVAFGSGGTETTITTPSGWTKITEVTGLSTKNVVFWRFLQAGDAAPSFTLSTSRAWCSHSTAFSGVDSGSPVNQASGLDFASASSYTSNSITPSVDNCMIVVCWGGKTGTGLTQTVTIPGGWTDTTGGTSSPTTPNQSAIAAINNNWATFQYQLQTTATSVSEAVTVANSATAQGFILALTPAAVISNQYQPLSPRWFVQQGLWQPWQGTGSDVTATATQITLSDTGVAVDSFTVTVAAPLADSGSASDSFTVVAAVPLADTGAGTDTLAVSAAIPLADAGSAADSLVVTAAVPLAETGQATDQIAVTAAIPLADSGSASDSIVVQQIVPKPLSDTGAAADSLTVTATVPLADLGAAADTIVVAALVGLADTGSAVDSFTVQVVGLGAPTPGTLTASDVLLATVAARSASASPTASDGAAGGNPTSATASLTATATPTGGPS